MTYNIYRTKTPGGEVCRILCCINVAPVIWSWTLFATNTWNLHASLFMYEDMIWESVHKYSLSVSIWSSSFNEALILAEVTAAESSLILGCVLSLQVQPMPLPWPDYNGSHSDCFCTSGKSKNHIWWCLHQKNDAIQYSQPSQKFQGGNIREKWYPLMHEGHFSTLPTVNVTAQELDRPIQCLCGTAPKESAFHLGWWRQ